MILRFSSCCIAAGLLAACSSDVPAADEPGLDRSPGADTAATATEAGTKAPDVCGAPFDTNRNGIVEGPEWFSFSGFAYPKWDRDRDERLTASEFHACWRALGWGESSPVFRTFDDDADGYVSHDEFFERDALQAWDTDGNGVLGPAEWPPGSSAGGANAGR